MHVAEGGGGHELQGRLVYALAHLHRSIRREAQRTGEWSRYVLNWLGRWGGMGGEGLGFAWAKWGLRLLVLSVCLLIV